MNLPLMRLAIIFTCTSCALLCVEGVEGNPVPASDSQGRWTLLSDYSDEFNDKQLDLAKWDNDVHDWGVWSWEPENVWVKDGYLHLNIQHHQHERVKQTLFYTSGIIKSRAAPIIYGYFEARIKAAPRYPGVCPAFWVFRNENGIWTEIDFVELTQNRKSVKIVDMFSHVFKHPKLQKDKQIHGGRSWKTSWDPRDDFHVYGCEWNDKEIRWYIDGKLVASRENEYWHQPLDVLISFGVRSPLKSKPSKKGFPTTFEVDYVRVWKKVAPNKPDAGDGK